MKYEKPLVVGALIRRYKRFLADVRMPDGEIVIAHVPNTGSMLSTREPGSPVAISHHNSPTRKLPWTLEMVQVEGCWVGVNTARPNRIVEEAILVGRMGPLRGYPDLRREVKYGERSRVDLMLSGERGRCYVEVKNVTYRVGRRAMFPDAVTERGARHLEELQRMVEEGHRGVILFLVNRDDCTSMSPARDIDPHYGRILDRVVGNGVEAMAYRVRNDLVGSEIDKKIRVIL